MRTQDVTSSSTTVSWEPPKYSNGILLGYEVCYSSNGERPSVVNVQNTTTCTLTDMKPWTMYSISVRAKTSAGFGEKSIPIVISTLESGMCIICPTGSHMYLHNSCSLNNVNFFFVLHASSIVSSPPLNVRTQDVTSSSTTVSWEPPKYTNGILLGYEVCYSSNGERPSVVNVQNTTTCTLTDMKPWTMYSISVRAKTSAGFGEKSIPVVISTLESGMCTYHCWHLCSLNIFFLLKK